MNSPTRLHGRFAVGPMAWVAALLGSVACAEQPNAASEPATSAMPSAVPSPSVAAPSGAPSANTVAPVPTTSSGDAPLPAASTPLPAVTTGPAPTAPGNGGSGGAAPSIAPDPIVVGTPEGGSPPVLDGGAPPTVLTDAGTALGAPLDAAPAVDGTPGTSELPDPGPEGDGDYEVGPNYSGQQELDNRGAPKGQTFRFTMALRDSALFDGQDPTLDPSKPVNSERGISVYVPDQYRDGTPAPVMVIQDGDGPFGMVANALDNMTIEDDPARKLPAFVVVAVQNGGNDAQGSERGLEYDTMSDRYARFIDEEVLPAVASHPELLAAYPNFEFTTNPSGRGTLGCSSGGAAAFTMAWFRPDLFSRVVAYSTTLVDQQNHEAPEAETYPHGAWDYHSELELIANAEKKPLRVFLNVNENDLRASDPESTLHNWVMANDRTAAALAAKGYHYRYVVGLGAGHCDANVQRATLADALAWVWRGYEPDTGSLKTGR